MKKRILFFAVLFQILLVSNVFADNASQITNGLNYLTSTQSTDGSWTSGDDSIMTSAEVIKTLRLLNQTGTPSYTLALTWLQNQPLETTNHLAARVYILAATGNDSSLMISYLDELVYAWGGYDDFTVNNEDTAFALQALKAINYADQTVIQSAISYLLSHQNTDGGWGFDNGDTSNIYMTSVVSRTLQHFSQTTAIAAAVNKAMSFIVLHQNSDGGFGSSIAESALAYIALVAATTDNTVLGNAAQFIINTQATDGSWQEDPYVTALALQVLYYSANKPLPPSAVLATVSGTVIDASTNQVLKGASAILQSNTAINVTSDSSGVFTLNSVPGGSQQIAVSLAGYATSMVTVNAAAGSVINLGNIPLSVNASTGIIKGTVTDAATGQPLAGAVVSLSGAYGATTTTGTDGSFVFTGVAMGSITITVSFAGYSTSTGMGSVTAGGVLFFSPRLGTESQTGTTGTLMGTVVAGSSSTPVAGAVITIDGSTAVSSDSQGTFSISNIAAGSHQMTVIAAGYASLSYSVIISGGGTTNLGMIILTSSAGASSTITGVVTDASTNKPIALADVSVVGTSLTTKTATDGSYSISGIEQLQFSVRASASGYNSKTVSTSTTQYGTYAINVTLDSSNTNGLKITSFSLGGTAYTANSDVMVNAVLENTSTSSFSLYVYLKIIDNQNNVVGIMPLYESSNALSIDPNSIVPISGTCNVRRNLPGNYSLLLSVVNMGGGSVVTERSLPFTIIPTVAVENVTLAIDPQFVDVSTTQNINISTEFYDRSNVSATVKAKYEIKDIGGTTIKEGDLDIPLSISDDAVTVNLTSLNYMFGQSGQYPVNLKILSENAVIAEATDNIYVAPPVKVQPYRTYVPESVLPGTDKTVNVDVKLKGVVAPAIISAVSDNTGNKITVNFNKTMADPTGKQAQFTVTADGAAILVSLSSLNQSDSTKIDLLLQSPVVRGQTVLLNYIAGDLMSADGFQMPNVTNYLVKNNAQPFIFSQDGLGDSGTIRGNPLQGNITMTGYNAWPAGFSKSSYGLIGSVFDGQNVWMIPRNANMVIKVDKDSGAMTGYNSWPSGFSVGSDMFNSSVFDGQNIWMIPLNADRIIKIDKDSGTMIGYNSWPSGFSKGSSAFIGGVFDGQNIWMIPYNADRVIKIDKDTGTMMAYNNWPGGFTKGSNSFQGAVFDGQNIWMIPFNADRIIKIDKDTGAMTGYNSWPSGFSKGNSAFVGGTFDGQNIWMIPFNADRIIKIDKDTGVMTGYTNWPAGVGNGGLGGVFDGQNIWMIPGTANYVVKIDKDSGSMVGYNSWPSGFNKNGSIFYGGVFDGQNIWMAPSSSDRIIKLSPVINSGNVNTYDVSADFSSVNNPNGVWSFGWSSTLYSDLHIYPSVGGNSQGLVSWNDPNNISAGAPAVSKNSTTSDVSAGTVRLQPLQVWFHPGLHGEYSHIRWTVPAEGICTVTAEFSGVDVYPGTTDVHVVHNTISLFEEIVSGFGNKKSYEGTITVDKGDIIDFAVGYGNGNYAYDSTGVAVKIAYLPTSALHNVRVIDTVSQTNINLDASSFSKAPYSITAGTDSTVIEWQYEKIAVNQIEDLNYNILLKNPVAGENRLVNNKLAVLYSDVNGNEVRTELPATYVKVLTSAFDSSIATNRTNYQANEDVLINAAITSKSDYARTIDAKVLIEDSQGVLVTQAAYLTGLNFAAGEAKTLDTIIFNTGSTLAGAYRAHLILYDNQEMVGEALSSFTIQQPAASASLSSSIATDKMIYNANESVTITGAVQSTSANLILNNLTARVTLSNASGTVLYTEDKAVTILTPGQLIQFKSYWNTATNPLGSYNVKLEVFDGVNLLSTSTASFSVAGTSGTGSGGSGAGGFTSSSVQGTISATPKVVYAGKEISIGYTITNSGNEDIPLLNIKILVVDPVTQAVKAEINGQQAVSKGTTVIGIGLNNISTAALTPGTYLVILQAATPAMTEFKMLSKANIEVKAGLEVTKTIPDTGNLLIWVNKRCDFSGILPCLCFCDDDKTNVNSDLLEKTLKEAGVSYHIVYNKIDFQKEMRNTSYTDYMILGDRYLLDPNYADELRELVYSGKGLISSLYVKYGELGPPVSGALWAGYMLLSKHTVDLSDSAIAAASSFTSSGKTTNVIALSDATVAGRIRTVLHSPAVILNDYGQGRSIYYSFDMLETLNNQNYTQLAALIKNSFTYVHKPLISGSSFLPAQLIPVEVKIDSLGGAFDLKIRETYPPGIKVYDPVTNLWITDNPWMKDLHIDTNATEYFRYYAMTPDALGTYTLATDLGYMENNTFQLYKTTEVQITVGNYGSSVLPSSIITALKALKVNILEKLAINNAIQHIEAVKTRNANSMETKLTCQANIADILEAIEAVMVLKSCDTSEVRLMMDTLMQIYEGKYYSK